MKFSTSQFSTPCNCRSIDECRCSMFAEPDAIKACIAAFSQALVEKLMRKWLEDGRSGWDSPEWTEEQILTALKKHIDKGDMVDVAAFAMFLWNRRDNLGVSCEVSQRRTAQGNQPLVEGETLKSSPGGKLSSEQI